LKIAAQRRQHLVHDHTDRPQRMLDPVLKVHIREQFTHPAATIALAPGSAGSGCGESMHEMTP
jgi:hypothetical protein